MNADVLSSTSKLEIAGGSGGSGGSGGLGGWGIGCGLNTRHGGKGGNGKNGESGLAGTIRVSTGSGDGAIKSDVGSHDIDVLYKPDSRECYTLMYIFNTFEFEDGDGVPHSTSLNVDDTLSLFDARSLGLAPLPTMRSRKGSDSLFQFQTVSFEGTGNLNGIVHKTYEHSFTGDSGYKVSLTGWTHTRTYHKGYLRNTEGFGQALVKNLDLSTCYKYRIYQFASSWGWTNQNPYSVNGVSKGVTTSSNDPNNYLTAEGMTTSNKKGEINFLFQRVRNNPHHHHVALSKLGLKKVYSGACLLSECEGNCKEDKDCVDNLKCFKRTADLTSPVPGCTKGGPMDKPDFNYCYNPVQMNIVDELSYRIEDKCTNRALVSAGSLLGK